MEHKDDLIFYSGVLEEVCTDFQCHLLSIFAIYQVVFNIFSYYTFLEKETKRKVVIQAWESHKKVKSKYPIYPLNISSRQLAVSCSVLKLSIYHNLHQYYRCQYDSHNNHQLDVQSWSSNIQFQSCSRYIICQWV